MCVKSGQNILMHKVVIVVVASVVKNLPGNTKDPDSIPGSGRSRGEGHDNPLQYPCLKNPMDREAGWAIVHGVAKSQTRL